MFLLTNLEAQSELQGNIPYDVIELPSKVLSEKNWKKLNDL